MINQIIRKSTGEIVEIHNEYLICEDRIMYFEHIDKMKGTYKWEDYQVI